MSEQKPGSQMRITPTEQSILKSTFKSNEELVRLMRKIFLPEINPYYPIGQNMDLWMTVKIDEMSPEQALINLKSRNQLISHIETCLNTIKVLAEMPEDVEDAKTKLKNSSK